MINNIFSYFWPSSTKDIPDYKNYQADIVKNYSIVLDELDTFFQRSIIDNTLSVQENFDLIDKKILTRPIISHELPIVEEQCYQIIETGGVEQHAVYYEIPQPEQADEVLVEYYYYE